MSIGIFKAIANGVHEKNTDRGALYVEGELCEYRTLEEWRAHVPRFADELEALLDGPYAQKVFFVVEMRDSVLHVMAYERAVVGRELSAEMVPSRNSPSRGEREGGGSSPSSSSSSSLPSHADPS